MKQETIGSRGTVSGFRPLIGAERWHRDDFTAEMLEGGWRPRLAGEGECCDFECKHFWVNAYWGMWHKHDKEDESNYFFRTKCPLPPPAVETFEAHGHIWYKHTPGDECPVEPDVSVDVLWSKQMSHPHHLTGIYVAKYQNWSKTADGESVIGYCFPDYPAVHTTLQQEQHVEKTMQSFQHCDQLKQQLTSIYNGWVHLPPETVAECIADVASVLYPTDAERCDAAFQRWWSEVAEQGREQSQHKDLWYVAWKAAKESKV